MYKFLFCFHLYKSFAFKTLNRNAPSFRSAPVFLPPLDKSFAFNPLNATFPFPQVFGLRRLRSNPPCSLWLQSVQWTNCFTRRAHITVPPFREPTVTAWRGTTLGRDIPMPFSYCATSLCAPATQQQGAVACTLRQVRRSICSPPLRLVFRLRSCTFRV